MKTLQTPPSRAFTLIEILIVLGILAILVITAFASMEHVFAEGHRLRRITDMRVIQKALGEYAANNNGAYPQSTGAGANWNSQCPISTGYAGGNLPAQNVVPGLVPTYLPALPADPDMNPSATSNGTKGSCCYIYKSDGKDYKILDYNCPGANYADPVFKSMKMVDVCRPGPNLPSFAIGVWTPGALNCGAHSPTNGW